VDERKEKKRLAILDAAGRVFAEKGYEHSSIRDIAEAAGVADGTIYNYYENKGDLMKALIERLLGILGAAESSDLGFARGDSLEARTYARMETLHGEYVQVAAVLPVILGSAELRERFRKTYLEPVLRAVEAELPGEEGPMSARILLSAVLGFQVFLLLGEEGARSAWEDPRALAKTWSRLIKALGAPD
jgi:AcrR family transcriptional regulator